MNAIIEGDIGTVSKDSESQELYNIFLKALRTVFLKKKGAYVGKEAFELLKKGWRLTQSAGRPTAYDFKDI